jgi:hypothetical protein
MRANYLLLLTLFAATSLLSCKKKTEEFQTEQLSEYLPLKVGSRITYRVDSTVFWTNFGRTTEVHSYLEKDSIDAQLPDALGRPSYRVFRFQRDTASLGPWVAAGTFFITPLQNTVEVIENNLRVIKLALPIRQDLTWKGNRFLQDEPFSTQYTFSNDDNMAFWDFTYEKTNDVFQYKQQTLDNVLKVVQVDEKIPLDTVDVVNNKATLPQNSSAVWLRGTATDTVILTVPTPAAGHGQLTIYNQTNFYASLNKIIIPPGVGLDYEFYNNKWYYPSPLTVVNNKVTFPAKASVAYIFGTATDSIKVNVSQIDTFNTTKVTVYNKSNFNAYCTFNPYLSTISIPPGYGRSYELRNGQWIFFNNSNTLLDKDPYIIGQPFGNTNYSVEKYAKGIGLVYQEFLMFEYQPNLGGQGGGYKIGFGVKRTMIEHN